jgi:ribosomal protein S12
VVDRDGCVPDEHQNVVIGAWRGLLCGFFDELPRFREDSFVSLLVQDIPEMRFRRVRFEVDVLDILAMWAVY